MKGATTGQGAAEGEKLWVFFYKLFRVPSQKLLHRRWNAVLHTNTFWYPLGCMPMKKH